tara:strand:- start:496 stop:1320 length:825 start_codon:yes stop_codon:yes gene_type:complete
VVSYAKNKENASRLSSTSVAPTPVSPAAPKTVKRAHSATHKENVPSRNPQMNVSIVKTVTHAKAKVAAHGVDNAVSPPPHKTAPPPHAAKRRECAHSPKRQGPASPHVMTTAKKHNDAKSTVSVPRSTTSVRPAQTMSANKAMCAKPMDCANGALLENNKISAMYVWLYQTLYAQRHQHAENMVIVHEMVSTVPQLVQSTVKIAPVAESLVRAATPNQQIPPRSPIALHSKTITVKRAMRANSMVSATKLATLVSRSTPKTVSKVITAWRVEIV